MVLNVVRTPGLVISVLRCPCTLGRPWLFARCLSDLAKRKTYFFFLFYVCLFFFFSVWKQLFYRQTTCSDFPAIAAFSEIVLDLFSASKLKPRQGKLFFDIATRDYRLITTIVNCIIYRGNNCLNCFFEVVNFPIAPPRAIDFRLRALHLAKS